MSFNPLCAPPVSQAGSQATTCSIHPSPMLTDASNPNPQFAWGPGDGQPEHPSDQLWSPALSTRYPRSLSCPRQEPTSGKTAREEHGMREILPPSATFAFFLKKQIKLKKCKKASIVILCPEWNKGQPAEWRVPCLDSGRRQRTRTRFGKPGPTVCWLCGSE